MESVEEHIGDDEVLLRRIPPSRETQDSICRKNDGTYRAASWRMQTESAEDYLSCSLLCKTTPRQLLDVLMHDNHDPTGWKVCRFKAKDVRDIGLEVKHTPTERDPGHCSIMSADGSRYPKNKRTSQKLAKRTRILTEDEITELSE